MSPIVAIMTCAIFPIALHGQPAWTNRTELRPGVYFVISDELDIRRSLPANQFLDDRSISSTNTVYYIVYNSSTNRDPALMNAEYPYDVRLFTTNGSSIALTKLGIRNRPPVPSSRKRGSSSRWINLNPGPGQYNFNSFPRIGGGGGIHEDFDIVNDGTYVLEVRVRLWHRTNALLYPVLSQPLRVPFIVTSPK